MEPLSRAKLYDRIYDLEDIVREMHAEIVTLRRCVGDAGGNVVLLRQKRGRRQYYKILSKRQRAIIQRLIKPRKAVQA